MLFGPKANHLSPSVRHTSPYKNCFCEPSHNEAQCHSCDVWSAISLMEPQAGGRTTSQLKKSQKQESPNHGTIEAKMPLAGTCATSGGIFKSAAIAVLCRMQRLMTTGEICRAALEWGLLSCTGKTPEASMASCLYGDVKRNGLGSLFIRYGLDCLFPQDILALIRGKIDSKQNNFTA